MSEMMDMKIGINGFGRIGRLFARNVWKNKCCKIVAINDPMLNAEAMMYMLKYDSVHGCCPVEICMDGNDAIRVGDCRIAIFNYKEAHQIPWGDCGAEYIAECSGHFLTAEKACGHLKGGAKKVILSAPSKDDMPTFVMGVNDCCYDPSMEVCSMASCTTNCMAPLMKLLNEKYGVEDSLMTTIHAVTASQTVVDTAQFSKGDFRLGRSALRNIIPTSTGAAKALTRVMPELDGKVTGMAFRVPVDDVSVIDLTCRLSNPMNSMEDFGNCLCEIAQNTNHPMHGIVGMTCEPVVSSDFIGDERSAIVDMSASMMLNPQFVKIIAYYDNEWGYARRLMDFMMHVCKTDRGQGRGQHHHGKEGMGMQQKGMGMQGQGQKPGMQQGGMPQGQQGQGMQSKQAMPLREGMMMEKEHRG